MPSAALSAALVTTALVLIPRASAAQVRGEGRGPAVGSEDVSLVYEDSPPNDCPTQAEFEAEVSKLTSKARFTAQHGARRVRIDFVASGRGIVGRLVTGASGKTQSSREVKGKDCHEVASALAIACALTIDPDALGLGEPDAAHPEPEPQTLEEEQPPPAKPQAPPPQPPKRPAPQPPKAAPTKVAWGFGVGLALESAWAPQMRPGGELLALLAVGERFRASVGVARFLNHEVDDITYGAWTAQGSLSFNLAVLGVLRPFFGVGYELGAIDAAGTGLPSTVQAQRPWQAASATLGLRFETESFFFQLGGSLLIPISRQRYLISDQLDQVRDLYEVPSLGLKQQTVLGVFL